ncbi:hypothetical protein [Saccharopolyspora sp. NPDC050642]|uniref:hypothetical protein n=1 Tax=Saccharopolyspora sp. NPDC050642 TaxID=3157099 RepID=UPI0033F62B02
MTILERKRARIRAGAMAGQEQDVQPVHQLVRERAGLAVALLRRYLIVLCCRARTARSRVVKALPMSRSTNDVRVLRRAVTTASRVRTGAFRRAVSTNDRAFS